MLIKKLRSRDLFGRKKKKDEGFTLVELLVVITILGILAAVVIAAVSGIGDKGEASAKKTDISILATSQEARCAAENGGSFDDPLILQREGFQSSQSGYSDVIVDKTQGPCDGTSFTVWQPKKSYEGGAPETIVGCGGRSEIFMEKPTRPLILDPQMDQIMIWLGLEDDALLAHPLPAANTPSQFRADHEANITNHSVTVATDAVTRQFTLAGLSTVTPTPDAILGSYRGQYATFSEQDLVNAYPADAMDVYNGFAAGGCTSDQKVTTNEGVARSSLEGVFADIRNVGIIFDVQEEAAELIKTMRQSLAASLNKAGPGKGMTVALASLASTGTITKYVGNHAFNGMVNLAGGENVFADEFVSLGRVSGQPFTSLLEADPDVLVFMSQGFDADGTPNCNIVPTGAPTGTLAPFDLWDNDPVRTGMRAWATGRVVCASYYDVLGGSVGSVAVVDAIASKLAEGQN